MIRRNFIKQGLTGAAMLTAQSAFPFTTGNKDPNESFNMKFSPDFGLFADVAGNNPLDQIRWAYDQGFRAWEGTNLTKRSISEQEDISQLIHKLGMEFGQFVAIRTFSEVTFAGRNPELRASVIKDGVRSVEIANRMGTKTIHNVLGLADPKLSWNFQLANAIELTKRLMDIYEPEGITMVIEPMNHKINHPGMFLHSVAQAYALVKGVDSSSVKILFDIYHVQVQEGNIIPTMEQAWDEIGYFQLGDTPGRNEPGTGEINYKNVLQFIPDKGYRGFAGLEHGTSISGKEGEIAAVQAYRQVDPR